MRGVDPSEGFLNSLLEPLSFLRVERSQKEAEGGRIWTSHEAYVGNTQESSAISLNISADDRFVILRPKDASHNEALVYFFAEALRDGPTPKRTTASDPNLESDDPLYVVRRGLPPPSTRTGACLKSGWLAFARSDDGYQVQWSNWDSRERKPLCRLPKGKDAAIAVDARGKNALLLFAESKDGSLSRTGHSSLWKIDAQGCQRIELPANVLLGHFDDLLVSPDGAQAAVLAGGDQLHIIDIANGGTKSISLSTSQEELLSAYAWDDGGLLLKRTPRTGRQSAFARYVPGQEPVWSKQPVLSSRDGQYPFSPEPGAIEVRDRATTMSRRLQALSRDDVLTFNRINTEAPSLLAEHELVLDGAPGIALNLATMKTRLLAPKNFRWYCATPDGAFALVRDDLSRLVPATREPRG